MNVENRIKEKYEGLRASKIKDFEESVCEKYGYLNDDYFRTGRTIDYLEAKELGKPLMDESDKKYGTFDDIEKRKKAELDEFDKLIRTRLGKDFPELLEDSENDAGGGNCSVTKTTS